MPQTRPHLALRVIPLQEALEVVGGLDEYGDTFAYFSVERQSEARRVRRDSENGL